MGCLGEENIPEEGRDIAHADGGGEVYSSSVVEAYHHTKQTTHTKIGMRALLFEMEAIAATALARKYAVVTAVPPGVFQHAAVDVCCSDERGFF